jgi:putative transposase
MSRLRRPFLYDRYFFVTVNLLESRCDLKEEDFGRLAVCLARMRDKQRFLPTTWVFLPDHWHAIVYPPHPLSISRVMSALKVSSTTAVSMGRRERGELWQERFFDHALRTVKDYWDTVDCIHMTPVRRGLAMRPEQCKWSSFAEYAGASSTEQERRCGLAIDRVSLPTDEKAKI